MSSRVRQIASLGLLWTLVLLATSLWLGQASALRETLIVHTGWWLSALWCVVAVMVGRVIWDISASLSLTRGQLTAVLTFGLLLCALVAGVAPKTNRILYDEQIYQGIAHNIVAEGKAQLCNDARVDQQSLVCQRGEYNKQPHGYPVLLSLAYRLTGSQEWVAHAVNNVSFVLLGLITFLAGSLLFESHRAGLFAAVAIAGMPELVVWSNTAASEPSATLLAATSFLSTIWYARQQGRWALVTMVLTCALALVMRPESLLCIAVLLSTLAWLAPASLRCPEFWFALLLGFALSILLVAHVVAVSGEPWGAEGARFSIRFAISNITVNGPFYFNNQDFPAALSLLALVGLMTGGRQAAAAFCYFALFWVSYLFFYAGSYSYGADVRFSLMTYPGLALLAGAGAHHLLDRVALSAKQQWLGYALITLAALNLLQFGNKVSNVGEEAWAARADVDIARQWAKALPDNSYVLTHNPHMFHLWGISAGQAHLALTEPDYVRNSLPRQYSGGVYFHWNFWCNVDDPLRVALCQRVVDGYPDEVILESRVRHYRYAMHQLKVR